MCKARGHAGDGVVPVMHVNIPAYKAAPMQGASGTVYAGVMMTREFRLITRHDRVPPGGSVQNPYNYAIAKLNCNTTADDKITDAHRTAMKSVPIN